CLSCIAFSYDLLLFDICSFPTLCSSDLLLHKYCFLYVLFNAWRYVFRDQRRCIFGWGNLVAKVLSERKTWPDQWDIWNGEYWNSRYDICCTGHCTTIWLENNGPILSCFITFVYCDEFLFG